MHSLTARLCAKVTSHFQNSTISNLKWEKFFLLSHINTKASVIPFPGNPEASQYRWPNRTMVLPMTSVVPSEKIYLYLDVLSS